MRNDYYSNGASAVRHNISLNSIEKAVCEAFSVAPHLLREKTAKGKLSRKDEIVKARHTFYWLAKKYTLYSLTKLGLYYTQDRVSVLHAIRAVDNLIKFKDRIFLPVINHAETLLLPLIIDNYEKTKINIQQRINTLSTPCPQPGNRVQDPRRCKPAFPGTRARTIAPPYFRTSFRINATQRNQ